MKKKIVLQLTLKGGFLLFLCIQFHLSELSKVVEKKATQIV